MATLFTTLMNTLNVIITKNHSHAHLKSDGRVPYTDQEAAQTTTNVQTVYKPSELSLVTEERKIKDSKILLIHLVYAQTGHAIPISACRMTSTKMDTIVFPH